VKFCSNKRSDFLTMIGELKMANDVPPSKKGTERQRACPIAKRPHGKRWLEGASFQEIFIGGATSTPRRLVGRILKHSVGGVWAL
jgi:hypothetical protein